MKNKLGRFSFTTLYKQRNITGPSKNTEQKETYKSF